MNPHLSVHRSVRLPVCLPARLFVLALLAMLLAGCASLNPYPERPTLSVTSLQLAPESSGRAPAFRVGLEVVNPNPRPLPLRGISYEVAFDGVRLLSGAAANLPTVPAFGTAAFEVDMRPDLLGGVRLASSLLSGSRDAIDYRFTAAIDAGRLVPTIRVDERGSMPLR